MLKLTTEDINNDNHSKFPEVIVIPLKDLSSKATRDGLLEIFMHTGLLEVVYSDHFAY
jgi:hypothetical protein